MNSVDETVSSDERPISILLANKCDLNDARMIQTKDGLNVKFALFLPVNLSAVFFLNFS